MVLEYYVFQVFDILSLFTIPHNKTAEYNTLGIDRPDDNLHNISAKVALKN